MTSSDITHSGATEIRQDFSDENSRRLLRKLLRILDVFKQLDAEMPLQQINTLVEVALNDKINMADLATKVGNSASATSRHVGALGDYSRSKNTPPHQVVKAAPNPFDRRQSLVSLTPKGRRVISDLIDRVSKEP